jgi:hypothetical protein
MHGRKDVDAGRMIATAMSRAESAEQVTSLTTLPVGEA